MKCEMKDCSTLAKLNSVFCQVFEADLEEWDGKVIKKQNKCRKRKENSEQITTSICCMTLDTRYYYLLAQMLSVMFRPHKIQF